MRDDDYHIYDADYDDDIEKSMGSWETFIIITLGAILFIILWPIFLALMIFYYINERNEEKKYKEYQREREEIEYISPCGCKFKESDLEKKLSKHKKSGKRKVNARKKKY